jgi:hypothetical protein
MLERFARGLFRRVMREAAGCLGATATGAAAITFSAGA